MFFGTIWDRVGDGYDKQFGLCMWRCAEWQKFIDTSDEITETVDSALFKKFMVNCRSSHHRIECSSCYCSSVFYPTIKMSETQLYINKILSSVCCAV